MYVETFDPQIATNNTLSEISKPPESNITLNCTRLCGPHIYDSWSFSLDNKTDFFVNNDSSKVTDTIFNNNVKLILCNHDFDGCNGELVEYSVHLYNATEMLTRLIVTCGAINTSTNELWTAPHSVQLIIGKLLARWL